MAINRELKSQILAAFRERFNAILTQDADSEADSVVLDASEYSDVVSLALFARDLMGKPAFWAGEAVDPFLACAGFWADFNTFCDVLASQDTGHNYDGMFGPKTVKSDMLTSLGRVAGANAKARHETDLVRIANKAPVTA